MKLLIITNCNHKISKQFVSYLKFKNINFDCIDSSKQKKIKISKNYDYLISFLNSIYIDEKIRKKIKKSSINFHPGPPEYPGFGCYNFALLNNSSFYGSTVHIMNNKFDNGKILNVLKFKLPHKNISLERLIIMTHSCLFRQAKIFIKDILKGKLNYDLKLQWKRKAFTKKEFEIARKIKLNDSKKDILNKIRAFKYKNYDSVYINFKGFKFEYKK
tara:strand:+ start:1434 stop:2081 length:648 start_codon:yes stop_codon:yes gene_type:complete